MEYWEWWLVWKVLHLDGSWMATLGLMWYLVKRPLHKDDDDDQP